jgi:polyhydroxyalkanoate synthesis regulator phasin
MSERFSMSIKKEMMKKGMQMMGDPRVAKLMQNPQMMKLMGAAFQVPGKVEAFTNEQARNLASALRLATAEDMKDLQRAVKRLEREVEKLHQQLARQQ